MKIDSPTRSFVKAMSWRLLSLVITFVVTLFITGSLAFAFSISLLDTFFKLFAYYFHERFWTYVRWGRRKHKKNKQKKQKSKPPKNNHEDDAIT